MPRDWLDPELLRDGRIAPFAKNGVGIVALGARIGQRDDRIGTERHRLVLSVEGVVPAPQLAAAGRDEQEEAIGVGKLVGFRPRLGGADLRIGEHRSVS